MPLPESSRSSVAAGVSTFLLLGVLIPTLVFDFATRTSWGSIAGALVVLEISAVRLALLMAVAQPRMLWLGCHLFIYPFMGVAALAQVSADRYPLLGSVPITDKLVNDTLFTVVVPGLLAFEVAAIVTSRRVASRTSAPLRPRRAISQPRVVLLAAVGFGFIGYTVATAGPAAFFSSREEFGQALSGFSEGQRYQVEQKTGLLLRGIGTQMPVLIALVLVITALRARTWSYGRLGRPATAVLVVSLAVANVVANNPVANSRFWFGVVTLAIAAIFIDWQTPRGFRVIAASALTVLIVAFGALDAFRRSTTTLDFVSPREAYLTDGSYSGFQTVMTGQAYVERSGTVGGEQLVGALFGFVPRSIWPGKPIDTGAVIDPLYNRSSTLWTELQINFGLLGVILGFLVLGVLVILVEQRMTASAGPLVALVPALSGVMILLLRGSLNSALGSLYPLVFLFFIMLRKQPLRRAEAADPAPDNSRRSGGAPRGDQTEGGLETQPVAKSL